MSVGPNVQIFDLFVFLLSVACKESTMSVQELSQYKSRLESSPNNISLINEFLTFVRDQQVRESELVAKYGKKIIKHKSTLGDDSKLLEALLLRLIIVCKLFLKIRNN